MTPHTELAQRCTRLEEELAFQDATVTALNSALADQQKQLDDMEHRIHALEQRFRELWEQSQQETTAGPPPHYGQVR